MAHVLCKFNNIFPQVMKAALTCRKTPASLSVFKGHKNITINSTSLVKCRAFHATSVRQDLLEFFDDPKNWGETEVSTGRTWRQDDLRIKSNSDLHKLWYVLLKEKNMLQTMEEEYKRLSEAMPSPERIYKIEESMKNLEIVVRERNRAYNLLETGHDGERPTQLVENVLGMHKFYRLKEYLIPYYMNTKWRKDYQFNHWDLAHVVDFKRRMREKSTKLRNKQKSLCKRYVKNVLKQYPNVSDESISDKFPDIDVTKLRQEMDK